MAKKKSAPKRRSERPPKQAANSAFTAYVVGNVELLPITTAPGSREWMDATRERFAYRCLPLVIANQHGWCISSPVDFSVRWNGGELATDLKIKGPKGFPIQQYISSHFGHSVFTFMIPYLFRTPPGINLWVKGPTNWIKDGVQALEGVIETDWLETTFTMNWKCTRPNVTLRFEAGEPLCMLVPIPRGLAESLKPECRPISDDEKLCKTYREWAEQRAQFNQRITSLDPATLEQGWQRDYMLGRLQDGSQFRDHQTKLHLQEFSQPKSP